jgi:hypothetical protein
MTATFTLDFPSFIAGAIAAVLVVLAITGLTSMS